MNNLSNALLKSVSKPGRYTGGEFGQTIKDLAEVQLRWAFCFPDTYEIGMSNLGMRILYGALNALPDVWCERVFAPWSDMEEKMREKRLPLCALESGSPLTDFHIVSFTLQYELCYSNVLQMLDLGGIPLLAAERGEEDPLIIGGGPCTYNPEPVADFFDLFSIGEGEEALPELARLYIKMKADGSYRRSAFLREAAKLEGFYVPSLYTVTYGEDGQIQSYTPIDAEVPVKVRKRIVRNLDQAFFPSEVVMPYIETVHDRIIIEPARGCIRGCRFCQAGMVYRPVRERSPETLSRQAKALADATGFDEISMCSLSISDYSRLSELTGTLLDWTDPRKISLSLPSLRADSFTKELMERTSTIRASGLTFAPEAGTQRLRNVINKNVTEEEIISACRLAFEAGRSQVKLYFMQGHPTETPEDLEGIGLLAKHVLDAYYSPGVKRARQPQVTVSVACFIPKPFTPFQWEAQDDLDTMLEKQKYVGEHILDRKVRYHWHDAKVSRIEAVFARGDRRLSKALLASYRAGGRFDSWDEYFSYDRWMEAFASAGLDPAFYANRAFGEDEVLPWDVIDCGVSKAFLLRERHRAYRGETTRNCAEACSGCGANQWKGDCTWCPKQ